MVVIQVDTTQVAAVLAFVAGVGSSAAVFWVRVVKPARTLIARAEEFWEDWSGVPDRPGVTGRPGVMLRLAGMEARQTAVEHELRTNGGDSLRDAVKRTETAVSRIEVQMAQAHVIALPAPV